VFIEDLWFDSLGTLNGGDDGGGLVSLRQSFGALAYAAYDVVSAALDFKSHPPPLPNNLSINRRISNFDRTHVHR
jgi:hypothetical protein